MRGARSRIGLNFLFFIIQSTYSRRIGKSSQVAREKRKIVSRPNAPKMPYHFEYKTRPSSEYTELAIANTLAFSEAMLCRRTLKSVICVQ